jgi:hypothetical protein
MITQPQENKKDGDFPSLSLLKARFPLNLFEIFNPHG